MQLPRSSELPAPDLSAGGPVDDGAYRFVDWLETAGNRGGRSALGPATNRLALPVSVRLAASPPC